MQTAMIIIPLICLAAILYTFLYLWHSIDSIKDSLENIGYKCDNTSDIKTTEYVLHDCITKSHKELLTEIACLATKNNEDIKRMKSGFAIGDILRFEGAKLCVFGKDKLDDGRTCWKVFGENGEEYRIYSDDMPEDIEFLGHRDVFD